MQEIDGFIPKKYTKSRGRKLNKNQDLGDSVQNPSPEKGSFLYQIVNANVNHNTKSIFVLHKRLMRAVANREITLEEAKTLKEIIGNVTDSAREIREEELLEKADKEG